MKFKKICFFSFLIFLRTCFGNTDLLDCRDLALENNPEIRKAKAIFKIAKEKEKQSLAAVLPSVGLSISRAKVDQDRTDNGINQRSQKYVTESDSIALRQPLYRPRLFTEYKKSKLDVMAEKSFFNNKEDILEMKVVETYFRLLRVQEEYRLLKKNNILLEKQTQAAEKSITAGRGTLTELSELRAAYDKNQVDIISINQKLRLEVSELSYLTGTEIDNVKGFNGEKKLIGFADLGLEDWESSALLNNQELKGLRGRIDAAKLSLSSEKFGRYPTVDLNMQIAKGSSESTFFVDTETKSSSVGITFNLPIYQGGSISSRIRQSALSLEAEVATLKMQEDLIRTNVKRNYYGLKENINLLSALKTALKSALIELEANKKSSVAGIRRQLDVLMSQQKFINVERDLIDAKIEVLLFWLNLKMLSGELNRDAIGILNSFLK